MEESDDVTSDASSHTATFTLYVCDSEYNGGIVTATLVDDDDNVIAGDWIYLEARPITVRIEADNPFPVTGDTQADSGPDTVTLTAITDAPTGMVFAHQWQQKSGTIWSDIADATDPTYKIADETSSTTKTIRVKATSGNKTYESGEVSITWNPGQLLREITDALTNDLTATVDDDTTTTSTTPALTPTPTAFQDAENDLLDCVEDAPTNLGGGTRYSSFAHLMTKYEAGSTLATLLETEDDSTTSLVIEGCSDGLDDTWDEIEDSFTDTFSNLRTTGTNATAIDEFLNSPSGQSFVTYMTTRIQIEQTVQDVVVPAVEVLNVPVTVRGNLRDGEDDATDFFPVCYRLAGLAYRDGDTEKQRKSIVASARIDQRLRVLNCMTFRIPHSYWIQLALPLVDDKVDATILELFKGHVIDEDDTQEDKERLWLDGMDFECTFEGPLRGAATNVINGLIRIFTTLPVRPQTDDPPSVNFNNTVAELAGCLKHDLAFGSLRLFDDSAHGDEPDTTWNPRNKHLADALFYADAVCLDKSGSDRRTCIRSTEAFWDSVTIPWFSSRAAIRTWAVASFNHKGWPITSEHIQHAKLNPRYTSCQQPLTVVDESSFTHEFDDDYVTVSWDIIASCVNEAIEKVELMGPSLRATRGIGSELTETPAESARIELPSSFAQRGLTVGHAFIYPVNHKYGPQYFDQEFVLLITDQDD